MPLTPTDVANKQFAIKMRGYAVDEVDVFLEEVETELARLLRENNDLKNRAAAPAPAPAPEPPRPAEPEPASAAPQTAAPQQPPAPQAGGGFGSTEGQEAALRTLLLAQRTADEAVAEARAEAAQIVQGAQSEADQVVGQARAEAEQTLSAARAEADQLRSSSRSEAETTLSRARAEAERTVATARDSALQMEQQAAARVQATTGDLEERKRSLETRIEELHAFEREYRTRLRAYLENQLRELVSRTGPDDDGGSGVPAAARSSAVGLPGGSDGPPREVEAGARPGLSGPQIGPFSSEPPTPDADQR